MNQDLQARPTVVVIGGGYGGVGVARAWMRARGGSSSPRTRSCTTSGRCGPWSSWHSSPRSSSRTTGSLAHGRVVRDHAVEVSAHRVVRRRARRSGPISLARGADRRIRSRPRATRTMPRTRSTTIGPRTTSSSTRTGPARRRGSRRDRARGRDRFEVARQARHAPRHGRRCARRPIPGRSASRTTTQLVDLGVEIVLGEGLEDFRRRSRTSSRRSR